MAEDFLGAFIGNSARARIIRVFVFNQSELFTDVHVAKRAGVSAHAAAKEIRALEQLGMLKRGKASVVRTSGNKRVAAKKRESAWLFNQDFKHAPAISKFVHEVSPVHYKTIIEALRGSGRLAAIILSGTFMGDPTRPADLIVAADALNEQRLDHAVRTLEPIFGREIRYAAFSTPELRYRLTIQDRLMRDTLDFPHLVLLDKTRLL
jgi:DNA-binding Lrp family transcriptional regulator